MIRTMCKLIVKNYLSKLRCEVASGGQKARQKKSAWWWPGHSIRPAEYERVRRAEKEIFNEKRRIGLKPKGVPR